MHSVRIASLKCQRYNWKSFSASLFFYILKPLVSFFVQIFHTFQLIGIFMFLASLLNYSTTAMWTCDTLLICRYKTKRLQQLHYTITARYLHKTDELVERVSCQVMMTHKAQASNRFFAALSRKIFRYSPKCNVYTMCRQTQLSTRWYANLLNVNLNYMFRPQSLAIIRLYKRKLIN